MDQVYTKCHQSQSLISLCTFHMEELSAITVEILSAALSQGLETFIQ